MFARSARWLARRRTLPTSARAVFGYYADSGEFDIGSLRLKRRVDEFVEQVVRDAFSEVEQAIASEFGYQYVSFEYDTKLLLPANLTLGYLYRHAEEADHRKAEEVTRLAVEALLDGDMRDAINDGEYEDFSVDFAADREDCKRVAKIAQGVLEKRVETEFANHPDQVKEAYDWAVGISEQHQSEDPHFRDLMQRARTGEETALSAVQREYKYATFDDEPALFTDEELSLPYLKTQYDRVGVIYDAMIEMYEHEGLPVEDEFRRSIVLSIIGAQVWLDDVDDYPADRTEGQLTPVTAEYLLNDSDSEAKQATIDISYEYLNRAKKQAKAADSTLTGIATEYIARDGDPSVLRS
ncbi:hypothetical protein ACFQJ7_12065 [Halovenus rubra]|uniref:Uncharacterized protein n=2 Tax=Halovenus rubra TaxID=869890 RepID=A0ACC7E1J4_9EURY|nr:hypothetical protein [Halovenus rubra]